MNMHLSAFRGGAEDRSDRFNESKQHHLCHRTWRMAHMAQMGRPGLSASRKSELWQMWAAGWSISEIGRALERKPGSILGTLAARDGNRSAQRNRSPHALRMEERELISRGQASGSSIRAIARVLHRPAPTVSREIARNGGRRRYRALVAEQRALQQGLGLCRSASCPFELQVKYAALSSHRRLHSSCCGGTD